MTHHLGGTPGYTILVSAMREAVEKRDSAELQSALDGMARRSRYASTDHINEIEADIIREVLAARASNPDLEAQQVTPSDPQVHPHVWVMGDDDSKGIE